MSSSSALQSSAFSEMTEHLEKEWSRRQEVSQAVRAIEKQLMEVATLLDAMHHHSVIVAHDTNGDGRDDDQSSMSLRLNAIAESAELRLRESCLPLFQQLFTVVVPTADAYWKYAAEQCKGKCLAQYVQLVQLVAFLKKKNEHHQLLTLAEVQQTSGVMPSFVLDVEEYLHGLCGVSNELARFCLNCVTNRDCDRARVCHRTVTQLFAGFRMLNLKNDGLRRKSDSVKYDVKKCEEIVYDMTIRGL
eukprot:ANDGO_06060.mRNA.1 Translin-1